MGKFTETDMIGIHQEKLHQLVFVVVSGVQEGTNGTMKEYVRHVQLLTLEV